VDVDPANPESHEPLGFHPGQCFLVRGQRELRQLTGQQEDLVANLERSAGQPAADERMAHGVATIE